MSTERSPSSDGPEVPAEVLAMLKRLWTVKAPILVSLLPRDAWVVVGLIQFASRNPHIDADQRRMLEQFGRAIQGKLVELEPASAGYLEMGWNPEFDVRDEGSEGQQL